MIRAVRVQRQLVLLLGLAAALVSSPLARADGAPDAGASDAALERSARGHRGIPLPADVAAATEGAGIEEEPARRWTEAHLPSALLDVGPFDVLYWQWLALPFALVLALGFGLLVGRGTARLFGRVVSRTKTTWDDALIAQLRAPFSLGWALAAVAFLRRGLAIDPGVDRSLGHGLRVVFLVVLFWTLSRLIDVMAQVLTRSPWSGLHPASRSLLPLAVRLAKASVFAIAVVAVLSELGYPVASLVAGLGIGGLAVALAAQKTVENLFGAFSIGADQPFREGDFVRVENFMGTVEAIGLRSTKFRTLERTQISIPNGKLADMRLETFAPRDRIRFATTLGLVLSTTPDQMRAVLAGFESILREEPKLWPEGVSVFLRELSEFALLVEVSCWFDTPDLGEFNAIRQRILLRFMDVVRDAGTAFALPSRTIHVHEAGPRRASG